MSNLLTLALHNSANNIWQISRIFVATEGGALSGIDIRSLKPILNEAEGFYQIGPRDKCAEHYVLSVTIAFATNLPQVRTSMKQQ